MRYFTAAMLAMLPSAIVGQTLVRQSMAPVRPVRAEPSILFAPPPSLRLTAAQRSVIAKQLTGNPQADASATPVHFKVGATPAEPGLFLYAPAIVSNTMSAAMMSPTSSAGFRLREPGAAPRTGTALFVCDVGGSEAMTWTATPRNYTPGNDVVGGAVQRVGSQAMFTVDLAAVEDSIAIRLWSQKAAWIFYACDATLLK